MKKTTIFLCILIVLASCSNNNRTTAVEKANEIEAVSKAGTVDTKAEGYMMKAKIEGKDWEASSMMPPDVTGRIVGNYEKNYIGLPYSKSDMVAGKKIIINEDNAVDLLLNEGCLYTNPTGTIEITKADGKWAEGKFMFTVICNSTGKKTEVTEGFFRISIVQ